MICNVTDWYIVNRIAIIKVALKKNQFCKKSEYSTSPCLFHRHFDYLENYSYDKEEIYALFTFLPSGDTVLVFASD